MGVLKSLLNSKTNVFDFYLQPIGEKLFLKELVTCLNDVVASSITWEALQHHNYIYIYIYIYIYVYICMYMYIHRPQSLILFIMVLACK